ncbi:MAG: Gfo/Idh/MocA family oxidoreductase [Planctomycetota bacterium]|nr:Gfo/Idh/MocA family oxidoreductase [Planctomycetota bacterium]MDA1139512.1 Gfo/Idh/MocA family oxidoreductase [Planctomycetota bacterium]
MNSPLGVLLVSGKYTHQENHSKNFAADPRCRVVALTDEKDVGPNRARLNKAWADELGISYFDDLEQALQNPAVDIVSVCAEPERRARILITCARAGKHLYIDKPMTPFLDAAKAVVKAVEAAGVKSQMFTQLESSHFLRARELVSSGRLGELLAIHADCVFAKGHSGTADLSRPGAQKYPPLISNFVDAKAELYAMGVYPLGFIQMLTGAEFTSVFAKTRNYFFEEHQRHGIEDFGLMSLTLSNGTTATVVGARAGWQSHPSGGLNQIHLIGSNAAILLSSFEPKLVVSANGEPWMPPEYYKNDPMGFWRSGQTECHVQPKRDWLSLTFGAGQTNESHFIDCILEDRESEMNAAKAAKLTEVLLAGYSSAASGEVVWLTLE